MREVRATAAAVVLLILTTASAHGQCVSSALSVSERGDNPRFLAGPTAWNGSILAVAGPELDREEFQVILYDEHGNTLAENEKIHSSGSRLIDVVWNGSDFGIFSVNVDGALVLTRVGTDGKIIGTRALVIGDVRLESDDKADILWSSDLNEYSLAHTDTNGIGERTIRLTRIRPDGKIAQENVISSAKSDSFVKIALTTTGTIGIFYEDHDTGAVEYVAVRNDVKKPVTVWDAGDDILVAASNDHFALLRSVAQSGRKVARWQTIDTSGRNLRRDSFLDVGTGADIEPLFLIARDSEFAFSFLEWRDGLGVGEPNYRLARFGPDEEAISDTYFAAAVGTRRRHERTKFGFEWTGSGYVSLASNENGDDSDTFLLRICPLETTVSGPLSARPFQVVTLNASAEGGVPGYTYTWTWGEGGFAQGPSLQINFGALGAHELTLTAKDAAGTTASDKFLLTISQGRRRAVRK